MVRARLEAEVDGGALAASLEATLSAGSADLTAIALPQAANENADARAAVAALDLSALEGPVAQLVSEIGAVAASVPNAHDSIAGVTAVLEGLEGLVAGPDGPLADQLSGLVDRLSADLKGDDAGRLEAVLRVLEALLSAPEGQRAAAMFDTVKAALGADASMPHGFVLDDLMPAIRGLIQLLQGLAALETRMEEAARLTGIMAAQLAPDRIARLEGIAAAVITQGGQDLAAAVAALDPADSVAVDAVLARLRTLSRAEANMVQAISEAMAFGDATLVHLNPDRLAGDLDRALEQVRGADVSAIERAVSANAARLTGLLRFDLPEPPDQGLEGLVREIEGRLSEFADGIAALDLSGLTEPLDQAMATITALPAGLSEVMTEAADSVGAALEPVRAAVEALPVETVVDALRRLAGHVAEVLDALTRLVDAVGDAIDSGATAAVAALEAVETGVDTTKTDLDAAFARAVEVVESVDIDALVAQVQGNIDALVAEIAKADMAPAFNTAGDAIGTAADVVDAVPFFLLPDDMEQDVVDAIRPIKQTDVQGEIDGFKATLGLSEEGLALTRELEESLAEIQGKIDALITFVRDDLDPAKAFAHLDPVMADLRQTIEEIHQGIDLSGLRQMFDDAKTQVTGLDAAALLAPADQAFDEMITALNAYAPDQLIAPLDDRVDAVRGQVLEATRLPDILTRLEEMEAAAKGILDAVDPLMLEPLIKREMETFRERLEADPRLSLLDGWIAALGGLVADGPDAGVRPRAFRAVADWVTQGGAQATLDAHAQAIAGRISATIAAVEAVDPAALAMRLSARAQPIQAAIDATADPGLKVRLQASFSVQASAGQLTLIAGPRQAYLSRLNDVAADLRAVAARGFGEAEAAAARLRAGFDPLSALKAPFVAVIEALGLDGPEPGLGNLLRRFFQVLPPGRIAGLLTPIFRAVRLRYDTLIESVAQPLKQGIQDLIDAIEILDLSPLRDALAGIYDDLVARVEALRPSSLLAEPLASFTTAQQTLGAFDPLGAVQALLDDLAERAERTVAKLTPSEILSGAVDLHAAIVAEIERLQVATLMAGVFDELDRLAAQVNAGLDDTATAFRELQDALPDQVGSTRVSVSVSVG
ncbi:hypothetical protein [Rhodospira trueperi]|uniref:Phage-related protein n=1 Tax=Rhodospira trueperi TaxID=69960 RepID=A0A1G6XU17_9PROT|nr:hypothetical protein [Rhodospira trueperi]SDD81704.1 hypothetical protein SAMN05421720_101637 [Rhodospira trueperi]